MPRERHADVEQQGANAEQGVDQPGASQPINLITDDARKMRVAFRLAGGPEQFEIARALTTRPGRSTIRRSGLSPVRPVLRWSA